MIKPMDGTEIHRSMKQTGKDRLDERKLCVSLEYDKGDISLL